MGINYSDAVKKSLYFCIEPKRWLPLFVTNFVTFLLAYTVLKIDTVVSLLFLGVLFPLLALINIWIIGALVYQSYKDKKFEESFRIAFSRYVDLLFATVLLGVMVFVVASFVFIPIIGFIISAIMVALITLAFFFYQQEIIINKKRWRDALRNSYAIFRKNVLTLVLIAIIVGIGARLIRLPFELPLVMYSVDVYSSITSNTGFFVFSFFSELPSTGNILDPMTFVLMLVFSIGSAIAGVFSIKSVTEFYLQMKKRFFHL
jgi:hypothetical protein